MRLRSLSRAGRRARQVDAAGAAVAEFVLVGALLVALFLGVLQVGLALHVRNTLVAAAAEGARYAANADRTPEEGAAYTREVIRGALADSFAQDVAAGYEDVGGAPTVVVEVRATLPVIGFVGPDRALVVRGHAWEEAP